MCELNLIRVSPCFKMTFHLNWAPSLMRWVGTDQPPRCLNDQLILVLLALDRAMFLTQEKQTYSSKSDRG